MEATLLEQSTKLKEIISQLDKDRIQIYPPPPPPGGFHFGGVHKIMVKAAKRAIYAVLGISDITD